MREANATETETALYKLSAAETHAQKTDTKQTLSKILEKLHDESHVRFYAHISADSKY